MICKAWHSNFDRRWLFAGVVSAALAVGAGLGAAPAVAQQATAPVAAQVGPQAEPQPVDVNGVWIDHTGRGAIEIAPCGNKLCGYIYWVKDLVTKAGRPILDIKNPDAGRRNKPICGTQILADLQPEQAARLGHVWGAGSIYDPERGEKFDVEVKLISANELSVLGYLGVKFLGETYTWKRAPAELIRCGPPRV